MTKEAIAQLSVNFEPVVFDDETVRLGDLDLTPGTYIVLDGAVCKPKAVADLVENKGLGLLSLAPVPTPTQAQAQAQAASTSPSSRTASSSVSSNGSGGQPTPTPPLLKQGSGPCFSFMTPALTGPRVETEERQRQRSIVCCALWS